MPDKNRLVFESDLARLVVHPTEDWRNETVQFTGWAYYGLFYIGSRQSIFEEGFPTKEEAIAAGKVRLIQACNYHIEELQKAIAQYQLIAEGCQVAIAQINLEEKTNGR